MRAESCPFCKRIAAGEYDYADHYNVAFQPLEPVTPGHFLVVPHSHVPNALQAAGHAGRALEFAGKLAADMGLVAANFITSAGAVATQSVFHLHVHVVPRRKDDGLLLPWTPQKNALPPRGPDGFREITCGACGETFGTNFADEEIECPDCDARRSPCCGSWFGEDKSF